MASVYIHICIRTYIHVYVHINLFLLTCMYKCAGHCPHQASSQWMTNSATKLSLFFLPVCEIIFVGVCSSPFRQPAEFIFWKFYISHRHCLVVTRVPNFGFGNVLFGGGIFSICWRNLKLQI